MEKLKLTTKVSDLKVGDVFWFSGGWKQVWGCFDSKLLFNDPYDYNVSSDDIMINSRMLVAVKYVDQ